MIPRFLLGVFLAAVMAVVGVSSYLYLDLRKSKVAVAPVKPTAAQPTPHAFTLPGTLYLSQSGALYSLSAGRFHELTPEDGLFAGWCYAVEGRRADGWRRSGGPPRVDRPFRRLLRVRDGRRRARLSNAAATVGSDDPWGDSTARPYS